jgi:hypothetical protein
LCRTTSVRELVTAEKARSAPALSKKSAARTIRPSFIVRLKWTSLAADVFASATTCGCETPPGRRHVLAEYM